MLITWIELAADLVLPCLCITLIYQGFKAKSLSASPLIIGLEDISSNYITHMIIGYIPEGSQNNMWAILTAVIYTITIRALSHAGNRFLMYTYAIFFMFTASWNLDFYIFKTYLLYEIYDFVVYGAMGFIIIGLLKDEFTGGKRNAATSSWPVNFRSLRLFGNIRDNGAYQAKTRR